MPHGVGEFCFGARWGFVSEKNNTKLDTKKWKTVQIFVEKDCTTEDYSVINLAPNAIFKQLELFVGNTNVIDAGVSTYHYKCITETLLSKQLKFVGVVCKLN